MIYPLSANNGIITDASGEVIATVEPGPFAQGRINARDLVELANLGYRTRQHEAELRNLTEIKGEASFAFSPSVMVEFTKEEFSNFQVGITALRHLAGRTETPSKEEASLASTKRIDVIKCARCGVDHPGLEFRLFCYPVGDFTHWGSCPFRHEPILMKITETPEEKKVESASTEIAEGYNPGKLTNAQVGHGWRLLKEGERQNVIDEEYRRGGRWFPNKSGKGMKIEHPYFTVRRRIS